MEPQLKKGWSAVAVFLVVLVLTMPIYSASALAASVRITKNSGQAGIDGFIEGNNDIWTVQATVNDVAEGEVTPEKMRVKLGSQTDTFDSCSSSSLGGYTCEYLSDLSTGVSEASYTFTVDYSGGGSDSSAITADSSGPQITFPILKQENSQILLDFTVTDQPSYGVGLATIEIMNAETGEVLQTIMNLVPGEKEFKYGEDGGFAGVLQAPGFLTGEGARSINIKAEDRLGHSTTSAARVVKIDYVKPQVVGDSLNFTDLKDFVGSYLRKSPMTIDIIETSSLASLNSEVSASSEDLNFADTKASCELYPDEDNKWKCTWPEVEVHPTGTITVNIKSKDEKGNVVESVVSKNFAQDTSAPTIDFFGTERTFEDKSYVKNGENRFILQVKDQGAGMSIDGIRANLGGVGGDGSQQAPDSCEQKEDLFICYWALTKNDFGTDVVRVSLSQFEDKAGNQGELRQLELVVDRAGPEVDKIEFYGHSEIGDKDYFQSNDALKIKMNVSEKSGLSVLVDLNNVVPDAANTYPVGSFGQGLPVEAGWKVFTQDDCVRVREQVWQCEFVTDAIKSGYDTSVPLHIKVQDTAGNDAQNVLGWIETPKNMKSGTKGNYYFELLGIAEEESPNFWEVSGRPIFLQPFVDLDIVSLIQARMPVKVQLQSVTPQVSVVDMNIIGCQALSENAPEISRSVLYGGIDPQGVPNPAANIIMEFAPFEKTLLLGANRTSTFTEVKVDYLCQLKIYSKVGKNAVRAAEVQEIIISVPFAFSTLGAVDENVGWKVENMRNNELFKASKAIAVMNDALTWIRYLANLLNVIVSVIQIADLFSEGLSETGDAFTGTGILSPIGTALQGGCLAAQTSQAVSWEFVDYLQIPISILTCSPNVYDPGNPAADTPKGQEGSSIGIGWYYYWQRNILGIYNVASGRDLIGAPATSLYDNIYTSALGLCLPGIIYNLNKAR